MLSIGELIDRLVIENIKLFTLREKLNSNEKLSDEEKVDLHGKMMILNENRGILSVEVDRKIDAVLGGKEKNTILRSIKTYGIKKN